MSVVGFRRRGLEVVAEHERGLAVELDLHPLADRPRRLDNIVVMQQAEDVVGRDVGRATHVEPIDLDAHRARRSVARCRRAHRHFGHGANERVAERLLEHRDDRVLCAGMCSEQRRECFGIAAASRDESVNVPVVCGGRARCCVVV